MEPGEEHAVDVVFAPKSEDQTGTAESTTRRNADLYVETDEGENVSISLLGEADPNDAPNPAFDYSPQNPFFNEQVRFDSRSSTDDYSVRTVNWDFDDDGEYEGSSILSFYNFSEPGEYNVTLNVVDEYGKSANLTKTVVVSEPEEGRVLYSNLSVSLRELNVSEKLEVSADVQNTGDVEREFTAVLEISDSPNYYRTATLQPGETRTLNFVIEFSTPGTYNVSIGNLEPVTVEVVGDKDEENKSVSVIEAIANLESVDDRISFDELQKAIAYWSSGETVPGANEKIDFETLQEIINLWSQGEKV